MDIAGALVDVVDANGRSPLMLAVQLDAKCQLNESIQECICFLVERGADVMRRFVDGKSVLHAAAANSPANIVSVLLQLPSIDLNTSDSQGLTSLAVSAMSGRMDIVSMLLERGADALCFDANGDLPYDVAAAAGQTMICELLESAGGMCKGLVQNTGMRFFIFRCIAYHHAATSSRTVIELMHENQRYSSLLHTIGLTSVVPTADKFSADNLQRSDLCGPWSDASGRPSTLASVHLPTDRLNTNTNERLWYWLTDWTVDLAWRPCSTDGWLYSSDFQSKEWVADPGLGTMVRRRRWIRVRKQKRQTGTPLANSTTTPESTSATDYIQRAKDVIAPALAASSSLGSRLLQLEYGIQVLLGGLQTERDEGRRRTASRLAEKWLAQAETLKRRMQQDPLAVENDTTRPRGTSSAMSTTSSSWQPDADATHCSNSRCARRFTVWLRRHHCRMCGRVFCDACSSARVSRAPGMIEVPGVNTGDMVRVCDECEREVLGCHLEPAPLLYYGAGRTQHSPARLTGVSTSDLTASLGNRNIEGVQSSISDSAMDSCPVCGLQFIGMYERDTEQHLEECLTKGAGGNMSAHGR